MLICIYNQRKVNEMENFKIYNNGKYDYKLNLAYKINSKLPTIINKIDNLFTNH